MRHIYYGAVALLLFAGQGYAQPQSAGHRTVIYPTGARVRVWADIPSRHRSDGVVKRWSGDSLWLDTTDGGWLVTLPNIARVDMGVQRTRGEGMGHGAWVGLAAALATDVLLWAGAAAFADDGEFQYALPVVFLILGVPSVTIGGAVVGGMHPGTAWSTVYRR